MLEKQQQLLADLQKLQADAFKLIGDGVKIGSIYQHLRSATDELGARVRTLERMAPAVKPVRKPKAEKS
jgi:hypothetical protein